jgi:putative ABC transport system ATP-binding protein
MLEISALEHAYAQNFRKIRLSSYTLESAQCGLLQGASGSGKSTILALIAGLIKTQTGSIRLNGVEISALSGAQSDAFRAQQIGFVPQRALLSKALSVEDNLQLARYAAKQKPLGDKEIDHALAELDLQRLKFQSAARLSGGEAQRLALARALVNSPKLVLADEPTANLDDANASAAIDLMKRFCKARGAALLLRALGTDAVIHRMESAA